VARRIETATAPCRADDPYRGPLAAHARVFQGSRDPFGLLSGGRGEGGGTADPTGAPLSVIGQARPMAATLPPLAPSVLLVGVAFLAGIGCTSIGPGGIFTTIALYTLTTVPSSTVAGTAQFTFVAVGLLGTVAYLRSGKLSVGTNSRTAVVLSVSSVLGALAGAGINAYVSRDLFGLLLGGFAALAGVVIVYRERSPGIPDREADLTPPRGDVLLGGLGLALGVVSGLLGVGGPVVAVPALVVLGVGMLSAVAVAQVQSVFIAAFATAGYALQGAVSLPLALLVGVPQLVGAFLGWRVTRVVDPRRLKTALGLTLVAVGPYLALQ